MAEEINPKLHVYNVTVRIIYQLDNSLQDNEAKKVLAELKQAFINPNSPVERSAKLINQFADEYLINAYSKGNEKGIAILSALKLYGMYQSGHINSLSSFSKNPDSMSIGHLFKQIRRDDTSALTDKRFNNLLSAHTLAEYNEALLILMETYKKVRNYNQQTKFPFALYAVEMYLYQFGDTKQLIINKWSKAYYTNNFKPKEENPIEGETADDTK